MEVERRGYKKGGKTIMIILDADEEQIAQSRAVLESSSESGRKVHSAGTLTLTNKRIAFESDKHGLVRMIALHVIQSVTPVKKDQLIISYPDHDSIKILKDKYWIKDKDATSSWLDLIEAAISDRDVYRYGLDGSLASIEKGAATGTERVYQSSESVAALPSRDTNSEVMVDVATGTLQWNKLLGWRKHPDEHLWQGGERMDRMTKQEWLAYKKEAFILYNKIDDLYDEYFEAKKAKNRQRCRRIKEEMKMIDRELHGGEGVVLFKNIAADRWPES
ncbi:hypothetical protein [Nitrososphaera sp.]|uniref:hypothetical protein n=1 Tax=Nitrososphaera sp. TaxID=1971748 RepID=UPI0017CAA059|nr:hypothetical protein [Nitrososphaera sp.]NWG37241.1 hypothetical protein [Nitrososphaera sp.]